jgi:hypothetical protein
MQNALSSMALHRLLTRSGLLAQLRPAAARSLATAPFIHEPAADLPRSRDRETADEETFERPFYCIKTNALPPWPRTTGDTCYNAVFLRIRVVIVCSSSAASASDTFGHEPMQLCTVLMSRHDRGAGAIL